jgi:hypothetical protein
VRWQSLWAIVVTMAKKRTRKSEAAALLARLRARKMTPQERTANARNAARARWNKKA